MKVRVVEIELTTAEGDRALPLVLGAIVGGALPAEFAAPDEPVHEPDEPPTEPSQKQLAGAPPSEPDSEQERSATKIAPPTGSAARVKAMIWSAKHGRFVRRTLIRRSLLKLAQFRQFAGVIASGPLVLWAISTGLVLGAAALTYFLIDGFPGQKAMYGPPLPTPEQLATQEATTGLPIIQATPESPQLPPLPGDASSKAGVHGEKPPMQKGALED